MKILGYIILTHEFRKCDHQWLARCKELGTSTFGRSLDDVIEKLNEAIFLHLNTLEDVGERERFFIENNITYYSEEPKDEVSVKTPLDKSTFIQSYVQPLMQGVHA